ncbi:protein kinase [Agrobacterium rhizogenes]|nr:protein kinase [Rhizobium rhizogenes]NTG57944.1 protein kinase [Rhizobium rhizogenes]NTH04138.1 protein kinase [Rhizobium rhizogenes]NTI59862.1 protein kinase [Rhizobium rhizogenes]
MSSKSAQPQPGSQYGKWTLMKRIDGGGNADVWLARASDRRTIAAIKILHNLGKEPLTRFHNEITALRKLDNLEGIVPILDYEFPEGKGSRPWYTMPMAKSSEAFLRNASAKAIVAEFVHLGETLAVLHTRKIAHRDIKPQNLLALKNRLCFSDFGLVKYPDLSPITPERRDVGAKFTMAPEMRREAAAADGLPADVFSFAKTLWIFLTGKSLSFDGPYAAESSVGLKNYIPGQYTTTLDALLSDCTQHDPVARPKIEEVVERLQYWLRVIDDHALKNANQWAEFAQKFFPQQTPEQAVWTDVDAIVDILNEIGRVPGLNHMFFPSGGGMTIEEARRAPEPEFIELHTGYVTLLKPAKLSFVSFRQDPKWDYLRLEVAPVDPTGYYDVEADDYFEYLSELNPAHYAHPDVVEYRDEQERELPAGSRSITRYLRGSFVFFSTSSPYNQDTSTYDARHEQMSEDEFREYMRRHATGVRR